MSKRVTIAELADKVEETMMVQGIHRTDIETLRTAIGAECTARVKLAFEQRDYVDGENRVTRQELRALREHYFEFRRPTSTFMGRLRWLFLGR